MPATTLQVQAPLERLRYLRELQQRAARIKTGVARYYDDPVGFLDNSIVFLRMASSSGVLVTTTMPSLTGVLQAVIGRSTPSTLTTQTRQAPVVETFFNQQSVGIFIPNSLAASRIVALTGTVTCVPLMVNVAVLFLSLGSVCDMPYISNKFLMCINKNYNATIAMR